MISLPCACVTWYHLVLDKSHVRRYNIVVVVVVKLCYILCVMLRNVMDNVMDNSVCHEMKCQ